MQQAQTKLFRRNILSLISGQSLSLVLNFFSILLAARYLGVEEFGRFASHLSLILIISKLIDFGLGPIIFRELSKDAHNHSWINKAISLKFLISLLVLLLLNVIYFSIGYDSREILLSNSLFVTIFISSRTQNFREILAIPFKVSFRMQIPMLLNTLDNLLLLVGVISIPYVSGNLNYFIAVYVLSSVPGFLLINVSLIKFFKFRYRFVIRDFRWLIKQSIPLAGFVFMSVIFQQIDISILNILKGSFDAGIFASATRLTLPLNLIPSTIIVAVFPLLVRNIKEGNSNEFIIKVVLKILLIISFSFALFVSFKPSEFVTLIFGKEYIAASLPTLLLCWSQVFLFFNFFALDLFTAYNIQKWNFVYSVLIVLVNIILDVIVIPVYSFNGVGFAKLIASMIGFIFIIYISKKHNITLHFVNKEFYPIIIGGTFAFLLLSKLPLLIYLIIGTIILILLLLVFKIFTKKETEMLLLILGSPQWLKRILKSP